MGADIKHYTWNFSACFDINKNVVDIVFILIHHIRNTPYPLPSPSQVVVLLALLPEPAPLRSRAASANASPTVSRVSTGLMIPSSHNLAVEYTAVDWCSISDLSEVCWAGSLVSEIKRRQV